MAYGQTQYYPGNTMNFQPNYQQPVYQQPIGMQPQAPQPMQDDRIWVANEQAAESFQVVPNGFVRLWDSNQPVYYEKRADATGRPLPLVAFEYKARMATAPVVAAPVNDWEVRLKAVEEKLRAMEGVNHDE